MLKFKLITESGALFLIRCSFPLREKTIKIHIIVDDDKGGLHKHPWDYTSFMILGAYKEKIYDNKFLYHKPFSILKRKHNFRHQVSLYRIYGIKIPCITVGMYSKKISAWCERESLCDSCTKLGYCKDKLIWSNKDD